MLTIDCRPMGITFNGRQSLNASILCFRYKATDENIWVIEVQIINISHYKGFQIIKVSDYLGFR